MKNNMELKDVLEVVYKANEKIQSAWLMKYQFPVTENTVIGKQNYDSLEWVEFVMELEKDLKIMISDDVLENHFLNYSFLQIAECCLKLMRIHD